MTPHQNRAGHAAERSFGPRRWTWRAATALASLSTMGRGPAEDTRYSLAAADRHATGTVP
jgi:hypothetical protein